MRSFTRGVLDLETRRLKILTTRRGETTLSSPACTSTVTQLGR